MSWQRTNLSVNPPSREIANTDREVLRFEAGEAITGASAHVVRLDTLAVVDGVVEAVDVDATGASVTVSGLTRGVTYEMSIVFTRSNLTRWTRTLVLRCIA